MKFSTTSSDDNRRVSFFILAGILFGVYCFVFGQSGLLERMFLLRQQQALQEQVNGLASRNEELLVQLEAWREGKHDREEAARSGLIAPGEQYVVFRDNHHTTPFRSSSIIPAAYQGMNVEHLRLLWLVISGLLLLTWFILKRKNSAPPQNDDAGDFDEN